MYPVPCQACKPAGREASARLRSPQSYMMPPALTALVVLLPVAAAQIPDYQMFHCIDGSNLQVGGGHCRAATPGKGAACAAFLRSSCTSDSFVQRNAVQYALSHRFNTNQTDLNLTNVDMDLAIFLASRGNFSWLGYGWLGCGCGWSNGGAMACDIYRRPAALDLDYGAPMQLCHETAPNSGIFKREWSKSTITVDCNAYTSNIEFKRDHGH